MHYYLTPYIGSGKLGLTKGGKLLADPFRPLGSDQPGWSAIDLRPAGQVLDGFALLAVPARNDHAGQEYLGADGESRASAQLTTRIGNKLGITLDRFSIKDLLGELLIVHAKQDGTRWKPLTPEFVAPGSRTKVYRARLGDLEYVLPVLAGGATITDDFNRADSGDPGSSSEGWAWTELFTGVQGTVLEIVSNSMRGGAPAGFNTHVARAEGALDSSDHSVQVEIDWVGANSLNTFASIGTRWATGSDPDHYIFGNNDYSGTTRWEMYKRVSGTHTLIGNTSSHGGLGGAGQTMKMISNGSSQEGLSNTVSKIAVTDTGVTSGVRTGLWANTTGATIRFENWTASDLAAAGQPYRKRLGGVQFAAAGQRGVW